MHFPMDAFLRRSCCRRKSGIIQIFFKRITMLSHKKRDLFLYKDRPAWFSGKTDLPRRCIGVAFCVSPRVNEVNSRRFQDHCPRGVYGWFTPNGFKASLANLMWTSPKHWFSCSKYVNCNNYAPYSTDALLKLFVVVVNTIFIEYVYVCFNYIMHILLILILEPEGCFSTLIAGWWAGKLSGENCSCTKFSHIKQLLLLARSGQSEHIFEEK